MKRIQNRVAESRYLLPVMAAYAVAVWYLGGLVSQQLYVQMAFLAVSTYLMVELNNSNALIRIYSRMVSSSFLALTSMCTFLFPSLRIALFQLCIISFYTILFHTYQDKQAPGLTFYAFLCLGIASIVFVQVLFFVPFVWLMMVFYLMAFSHRMFWASIVGIAAPYWVLLPVSIYTDTTDQLAAHFAGIARFEPLFQYQHVGEHQLVALGFVFIVALIGVVHFLRHSYQDKIRTRMLYEFFIAMLALASVFVVLQPQHADMLLSLIIINTSPLIAHFIALTRTRATNVAFFVLIALTLLLTAYHLWIPSLLF